MALVWSRLAVEAIRGVNQRMEDLSLPLSLILSNKQINLLELLEIEEMEVPNNFVLLAHQLWHHHALRGLVLSICI